MHVPPDCPYKKRSEGLEKKLLVERALADQLAEALREISRPGANDFSVNITKANCALTTWEEARHGNS